MKVYGLTDSGICRAENQDAYAAYRIAWRRRRHLFHSRLEGEVQHQMLGCSFEGAFGRETLEASPLMPNEEGVEEAVIAVVCDGMGGVLGGEIASRLATEAFVNSFVAILLLDLLMGIFLEALYSMIWAGSSKLF